MLHLYRRILKAAKHFPSVKKASIIQEIKTEFRENKVRLTSSAVRGCPLMRLAWAAMRSQYTYKYAALSMQPETDRGISLTAACVWPEASPLGSPYLHTHTPTHTATLPASPPHRQ